MIREIHSNDIETCANLLIEAYNTEPWNNRWTIDTANKYLNEFYSSKNFVGFVICENDVIIGAMFAHRKTWWTNDELFVDEFYIAPRLQRQGYGKSLLEHAELYTKSQNLAGLTLLTNRYFPAKNFYEKHNYIQADHVVFMYKEI